MVIRGVIESVSPTHKLDESDFKSIEVKLDRFLSTLTGNLQVLTLPAESTASTKMLTSPATSGTQSQEASGPSWRMVPHLDQPPCSQTNL